MAIEKAVFISDIHLKPIDRRKAELLSEFIESVDAEALFILGDFFDFWVGKEQLGIMDCLPLFERIKSLSADGTRICFLWGNRDFLLNQRSVRPLGGIVCGSYMGVLLGDRRVHLSHGDNFLKNDETYLLFRAVIRQRPLKACFKHLVPLKVRMLIAGRIRAESEQSVRRKVRRSERIVQLSERSILATFRKGYDVIVCGHIHRPTVTEFSVGGRPRTFYTLSNWSNEGGWYLVFKNGSFSLRHFPSGREVTSVESSSTLLLS